MSEAKDEWIHIADDKKDEYLNRIKVACYNALGIEEDFTDIPLKIIMAELSKGLSACILEEEKIKEEIEKEHEGEKVHGIYPDEIAILASCFFAKSEGIPISNIAYYSQGGHRYLQFAAFCMLHERIYKLNDIRHGIEEDDTEYNILAPTILRTVDDIKQYIKTCQYENDENGT